MLHERPCLLLAAVSNAASQDPDLQESLAKELKDSFAQQIVSENLSSLDVLQALLVHLAWSQYYLIPRSMQAYKYMQMAIGVLVDLGLDNDDYISKQKRPDSHLRTDEFRIDSEKFSVEAERTALGCYYLSAVISLSMHKPNTLRICHEGFERARRLGAVRDLQSDVSIVPLMEYQHLLQDISDTYKDARGRASPSLLPTCALRLAGSLDVWWESVPNDLRESGLFLNRYYAARISIFELGILFNFKKIVSQPADFRYTFDVEKNLLVCVKAIKHYVDSFLAIDFAAYTSLPMEEWFRLIIACIVLYKLSTGPREVPSWDPEHCHQIIDLEAYLTAIAHRLRSTRPSLESLQPARDELYYVLPLILESARDTYKLSRDAPILVPPGHPVHIDLSRSRQGTGACSAPKCPATGFWVDKACEFDCTSDWSDASPPGPADPADLKARSDRLWNEVFEMVGEDTLRKDH